MLHLTCFRSHWFPNEWVKHATPVHTCPKKNLWTQLHLTMSNNWICHWNGKPAGKKKKSCSTGWFSAFWVQFSSACEKGWCRVTMWGGDLRCRPFFVSTLTCLEPFSSPWAQNIFGDFHHFPFKGTLNPFVYLNTADSPSLTVRYLTLPNQQADNYLNFLTHRGAKY